MSSTTAGGLSREEKDQVERSSKKVKVHGEAEEDMIMVTDGIELEVQPGNVFPEGSRFISFRDKLAGKFARICVEINLKKQLVPQVEVRGRSYAVEYEGLHLICFHCGRYGHSKDLCLLKKEAAGKDQSQQVDLNTVPSDGGHGVDDVGEQQEDGMGSGMNEGFIQGWSTDPNEGNKSISIYGNEIVEDRVAWRPSPVQKPHSNVNPTQAQVVASQPNRNQFFNPIFDARRNGIIGPNNVAGLSRDSAIQHLQPNFPPLPSKPKETSTLFEVTSIPREPADRGVRIRTPRSRPAKTVANNGAEDANGVLAVANGGRESFDGGTASLRGGDVAKALMASSPVHVDEVAEASMASEGFRAQRIMDKFGFDQREIVEAVGYAGGIWCLWKNNGSRIRVVQRHNQFIHFHILDCSGSWFLTIAYGSPHFAQRGDLWNNLKSIGTAMVDPWCLVGDFNAFLFDFEKYGGSNNGSRPDRHFRDMVDVNSLVDLGYSGPGFTWKRGGVAARLDRALANTGWGLVNQKDGLWARVLRAKYKCGDDLIPKVGRIASASRLWNGIADSWKYVQDGMVWRLGDGKRYSLAPLSDADLDKVAADFVSASGGWEWGKSDFLLPNEICSLIAAVPPPSCVVQGDHVAWRHSSDGVFSTKSAYLAITKEDGTVRHSFWKLLWKWKGMEKVRSFLWLCGHDRLLTNVARKRRGLAATDVCARCNGATEDLLHTLRDCAKARCIWLKLVHPSKWHLFFNVPRLNWLSLNLGSNMGWHGSDWGVIFAYACWYIWRMRNAEIFDSPHYGSADPVYAILKLSGDSSRAMSKLCAGNLGPSSHIQRFICWEKPNVGWVKFNVDAASRESLNLTACGGIARDSDGRFLIGFMRNLGDGSVLNAELWGISCALEVAWRSRFKKVLVESDCLLAVNLVNDSFSVSHPCSPILARIHYWISCDWEVQVVHIHREGNRAADTLAGHAFSGSLDLIILDDAPAFLFPVLCADLEGRGSYRLYSG
ncbi:ribonuclease H [Senna tora]|uniref:Ribonuclease H n=1 Tax=Senna tora TaxID=362788 RepID=A0A834TJ57_9FABA|nr:ribonuclease H [Senna tora]